MLARHAVVVLAVAGLLLAGCGEGSPGAAGVGQAPAAAGSSAAGVPDASAPEQVPAQLRFTAKTIDGTEFSGQSLAGKTAVLWFWAPWCPACKQEAPDVAAVARRFGSQVSFVGVPGKSQVAEMRKFVADYGLAGFPHVVDADGSLWTRFGVTHQPAYAFVTGEGKVEVEPNLSKAELEQKIRTLLAS